MLPIDRRQQILALLDEQGRVTISALSEAFQVSEMTIHRDLDLLAGERRLRKVRGGAVSMMSETAVTDHCLICHKQTRRQTQVILRLTHDRQRRACCPHCGFMYLAHNDHDVVSVLVTGFLYGRTLEASTAHYLVHPDITVCCTPTILAFERDGDARRFRTGFGGELMDFSSTVVYVREAMRLKKG